VPLEDFLNERMGVKFGRSGAETSRRRCLEIGTG